MKSTSELVAAIHGAVRIVDLAHTWERGMSQSSRHPRFDLVIPRRHGDSLRSDGSSGANDLIITGSHVGTHIDALSHISQDMTLHGGIDATAAQQNGLFTELGAEQIPPIMRQGVLLDVAGYQGLENLPAGYTITAADLAEVLSTVGVAPKSGAVLLVRTGWSRFWNDPVAFESLGVGLPGLGAEAAEFLADLEPLAVGIDTLTVDAVPPGSSANHFLPAHRVLLVERGIYIMESLDMEGLSTEPCPEFLFVAAPLRLVGATGSPIRPLAVFGQESAL